MSLFDGLDITDAEQSMMFNQLFYTKAVNYLSRARPLLFAGVGEMTPAATPLGTTTFKKLKKITGDKIEIRKLGKTVRPNYLAAPADELAAVDFAGDYAADYWGNVMFYLAHLARTHPIPASEFERIRGKEAKTTDFIGEVFDMLLEGYLELYGEDFHGQDAPGKGAIGGWQYAVSDGVSAGETGFAVYGIDSLGGTGLDRGAAGNEKFQSYVKDCGGSLTMKKFRAARNRIKRNGGTARLAVVNEDGYTEVETMLDGYTVINQVNDDWRRFEGEWIQLGKVKFALDADAPAGLVGIFDTDHVHVWMTDMPFTKKGIQEMPHLEDGYGIKTKAWIQQIFTKLNVHAKLKNCGW